MTKSYFLGNFLKGFDREKHIASLFFVDDMFFVIFRNAVCAG